jgi:hypothetical protein
MAGSVGGLMSAFATKGAALIAGVSSGIGAIYADRVARRGYNLILVARNRSGLAALSQSLKVETDLARIEATLRGNPAGEQCRRRRKRTSPPIGRREYGRDDLPQCRRAHPVDLRGGGPALREAAAPSSASHRSWRSRPKGATGSTAPAARRAMSARFSSAVPVPRYNSGRREFARA